MTELWDGDLIIDRWQVAPYIAKKINNFRPYFGLRYSDFRIKDKSQLGAREMVVVGWAGGGGGGPAVGPVVDQSSSGYNKKYKAADSLGLFTGLDYKISDNWKLNLETRFVDETGGSLSLSYKF